MKRIHTDQDPKHCFGTKGSAVCLKFESKIEFLDAVSMLGKNGTPMESWKNFKTDCSLEIVDNRLYVS